MQSYLVIVRHEMLQHKKPTNKQPWTKRAILDKLLTTWPRPLSFEAEEPDDDDEPALESEEKVKRKGCPRA